MYVRVWSNVSGYVYNSMAYATVNIGWYEKYIVFNQNKAAFELVDYLDKTYDPAKPLVRVIQTSRDGFKEYEKAALLGFKDFCKNNEKECEDVSYLMGYPDVCENYEFLSDILTHREVPQDRYAIRLRDLPDANEWHYIKTQADADDFMRLFVGFHDSTLDSVSYSEDTDGKKEATAIFDRFGCGAELCFEGIQLLKIVPAGENYSREFFEATLIVDDSGVCWAEGSQKKPDPSYNVSMIQSLSLKWREYECERDETY